MVELFANCGDPDQTPHSAASDLHLHCLPITLLGSPDCNGLTPSAPNFRRHLSSAFFILTNYCLKRCLYVKLKD